MTVPRISDVSDAELAEMLERTLWAAAYRARVLADRTLSVLPPRTAGQPRIADLAHASDQDIAVFKAEVAAKRTHHDIECLVALCDELLARSEGARQ